MTLLLMAVKGKSDFVVDGSERVKMTLSLMAVMVKIDFVVDGSEM